MAPRMMHRLAWLLLATVLWLAPSLATAQTYTSGSTGADGPFSPPGTVPAGSTVTGSTVTVPLPPSGIFHFTTISIPAGVTVTFTKNAANTPAILLATGNITVSGTLDVSGKSGGPIGRPGAGGPGGFDGGAGGDGVTTTTAGAGLGPGGGLPGTTCGGTGGSYGTQGTTGASTSPYYYSCATPGTLGPPYGSPLLRPILGGSGGSGGTAASVPGAAAGSGGGGGGALILATSGALTLNSSGQIVADGGALGAGISYHGGGGVGARSA